MYKSNIKGSVVSEVKTFKYFTAGKTMAEFELLMFEDNCIGTQGKIVKTDEFFSVGKVYGMEDYDTAVQETIDLIEEKIKDDEYVLKTINNPMNK